MSSNVPDHRRGRVAAPSECIRWLGAWGTLRSAWEHLSDGYGLAIELCIRSKGTIKENLEPLWTIVNRVDT